MELLNSNKGQVFTADFAIALFLFTLVVSTLILNRNLLLNKIHRHETFLEKTELEATLDSLILQPGVPEKWNLNTVEVVGLVGRPNELNETKLKFFEEMKYGRARDLLGIEKNFYFVVKNNITTDQVIYSKGEKDWGETSEITVAEREVFVNGSIVVMRLIEW